MSPTPPSLHLSAITAFCICKKITTFCNMFTSWFPYGKTTFPRRKDGFSVLGVHFSFAEEQDEKHDPRKGEYNINDIGIEIEVVQNVFP